MCDLDEVFRALADRRRRQALCCLMKHHTVSLPDLAELLAENERGEDVTRIPSEHVRDVYFSLYHNHVPTLEDANLVNYEQEEDLVVCEEETTSALAQGRDRVNALLRVS